MELVVIGLVVLLVFGTRRLPELGSGLGQAISNFRKSYKDGLAIDVTPKDESKPGSAEKGEQK
jgi:sec-independent protein translocase protein TatA